MLSILKYDSLEIRTSEEEAADARIDFKDGEITFRQDDLERIAVKKPPQAIDRV